MTWQRPDGNAWKNDFLNALKVLWISSVPSPSVLLNSQCPNSLHILHPWWRLLLGLPLKCAAWPPKSVWANSEQIVANNIIIVVTYSQHFWSFALAPFALALPLSMIWESVFTQVKGNNSAFNFPGFALGLRYRLVLCLERYSPQVWDVTTWGSPDPHCMPRSCFEGLDSTSPWTSQCQLMMSFKPSGLRWLRWLDDLVLGRQKASRKTTAGVWECDWRTSNLWSHVMKWVSIPEWQEP